ncbi:hypothetical protein QYH69_22250 [Paraburkholderia sp. SARCC-3016]|uniref:hypothetical protein n=1 Tax=Paraburkholderia sp. SARCC-3016 TaxID=3058611 RepID=UPI002806B137|nr:hypothetical protein [Paraburkholderia sp. SARCC-3016]MDQ7979967.1 hypothetical protein [Paraburkholderia sp. SARCC-3016]
MSPQLAEILQDALNFTRYAASPFVLNGRPDSIRLWLGVLREQLACLIAKVDRATDAVALSPEGDAWTDEERVLSHEWVRRHYPNETASTQAALRMAWRDGQRLRSAHPDSPRASAGTQFERLTLEALRKLVASDDKNSEWSRSAHEFLQALPAGHWFRYLEINRTVIRDVFLKHGVFPVQSPRDIPNSACEAVEELLNHAEEADEYKHLYRDAARDLASIRQALNIPNDEIGIVGGVGLILETIANLKRPQQTVA